MGLTQVVADGAGAGVEAGIVEVLAPPDDLVFDAWCGETRWPTGTRRGARAPRRHRLETSWTWRWTHDFDVPVAAATARTERPSTRTALTEYWARSTVDTPRVRCPRISQT